MPNPPEGWPWWILSVVVAGLAVNLLGNWVQRCIDRWSEHRQSTRLNRNKAEKQFVEQMVSLIEADKSVIGIVTHHASTHLLNATYSGGVGAMFLISAILIRTYYSLGTGRIIAPETYLIPFYTIPTAYVDFFYLLLFLVAIIFGSYSLHCINMAQLYESIISSYCKHSDIPQYAKSTTWWVKLFSGGEKLS